MVNKSDAPAADAQACPSWCNHDSCGVGDPPQCDECPVCMPSPPQPPPPPRMVNESAVPAAACEQWCSHWTCGQEDRCGGCQICLNQFAPRPPPPPAPPRVQNRFPSNPFATPGGWWVDTNYNANLKSTISRASPTPEESTKLSMMMDVPSAVWLPTSEHVIGKVPGSEYSLLETVLRDAASKPIPQMLVLIFYDLPNRDCAAMVSPHHTTPDPPFTRSSPSPLTLLPFPPNAPPLPTLLTLALNLTLFAPYPSP